MMNDERILKYLSGLLSEKEKELFEAEIAQSSELREQLKDVRNSLAKMKSAAKPEVDETYFTNLTPKIKERAEKQVKWKLLPQLSFAAASLVPVLIFVIYYGKSSIDDNFNIEGNLLEDSLVINEVNKYFSSPLDEEFLYFSVEENPSPEEFNSDYEVINDKEAFEELMTINLPVIDDYQLLDNIGNTDLIELGNAIKDIKIY